MKRKSLHISEELHNKIEIICAKERISIKDYVSCCLELCIKENITPKQQTSMKELKNIFVKHNNLHEKTYAIPAQLHNRNILHNLEDINHDVKALKVKMIEIESVLKVALERK